MDKQIAELPCLAKLYSKRHRKRGTRLSICDIYAQVNVTERSTTDFANQTIFSTDYELRFDCRH